MLMRSQMAAEFELVHDKVYISRSSLYLLINALSGAASNGTRCGACEMVNQSANEVLEKFAHHTGITREQAYEWMKR